ncbi:breast cancer type 1 susceptibility protein homolog isoform X1 [Camponotus floridanus]|uniref:breast cancer type 1 susceptibility protein homolog isoform X1 n=2 Tax=Camponotus floridanus TaxID=104421 RepID=UPI000DC67076|nr:breast cancer type 1 susceptibility protein homolog isoform X1 [Camponotus floridanus]XP_011266390.2 breast cancer type 1 susceptibility protein homolog isoform X1 [Camponotus floridanus]
MAEQIQKIDVDKLSESVNSLQKCLECTICLQLMIEPTKTRCGHSFCKSCIGKVLRKKNASCPLCKKNLNRRNVSKDDHLEACITKFKHLVTAIQLDSNIDICSHSKPRNTRESHTSIMIKRDDSIPADENENAIFSRPDVKVRTWLYHMPDEPSCVKSNNLISDNHNELNTTDINENDKSNRRNRRKESLNKQNIDHMEDTNTEGTSRIRKENLETKKLNEEIKTDSATTIGLKYKAFHATIREKLRTSKLNIEKTNNQNNSSLTTVNDQTCQISTINNSISNTSSAIAVQSSSADWTRMIEFGKATKRGKKRKMKKLNVSTEKNKNTPRIIENVTLSPNKKYNLTKIVPNNNNNKKKKNNQKENTIDKNLDLSSTNVMPSEVLSETDTRNQKESAKDNANSSTLLSPNQLSIKMQEEENERIRTMNLSSSQLNEIIGFENVNKNCQASQNRCREESPEIVVEHYDSLLPSPKKLIILTPQKLNESVREHEIIRDIAQTPPVDNFGNLSPTKNRTFELERNNNTQRKLEEVASSQSLQSPISKARLSLKRKSGIEEKKKTDSPLLDQVPLIDKLSIIEKDNINDRKYSYSYPLTKDGKLFDRLSTVKRDLNLEIIDEDQLQTNRNRIFNSALVKKTTDQNASKIICQEKLINHPTTSKKLSKNIKNQRHPVKFLQKGTMIRRRNVKYFYLGTTKRESAQVCNIASVCNMQQSISKFDMLQHNIMNMSCNLARSPNRSNDSQDTMDITVMENISSVTQTISRELSAASPHPREISATSMPKKDIDHQKKTTMIEDIAKKSAQSPHKIPHVSNSAIKKISRVSGTSNSIKLLSPDKDSQLKFLAIDSPMSEHGESGRANSTRQQTELKKPVHAKENNFPKAKNSHFAASTSKAQELFIIDFDRKKRTRYISDKELFDDNTNDSDSASDSGRRRIKRDRYNRSSKNAGSSLDASKKHRSNSADQDVIEVISLPSKEQDTCTRKFRRILQISSSDTESESTEHIARNCKRPRADDQSDQRNASIMDVPKKKCLSIRNPSEEKLTSHRPVNRQKGLTMRESDMFESNSIFNSENLDYILQQSMYEGHNGSKKSEKITEDSNDDIINRVLQINRSQNNSKACRSLDSAPRNIETSQREKNSGECCKSLLQDNFDEIIANVELPQSHEDMIPCTDQSIRSNLKSGLLAEQRTSNCLVMTDEPCGTTQETPILSGSSTHDIFEYFPKNLRKRKTIVTSENLEKEIVKSPDQKRHDYTVDRREKKNVTASANTIDIDPCRRIILKHNLSYGREEFSEEFSSLAQHNASTDRPHIDNGTMQKPVVGTETTDDFFDSLMDVTQHQVQLQKFEKELFDIPVKDQNQRTTKITLQEDSSQEKQHTPEKRKKDTQDEKAAIEVLSADEDDVVEKTPERKMKNNGNNMKLHESRKNLSYLSPISKPHFEPPSSVEQTPSTSKIRSVSKNDASMSVKPLYHSTPQNSTNKLKNVCQQPNRRKLCFMCSGLTATRLAIVKEFATTYNINFVNQFESDITHVIVNTIGEKNAAKSTLKFLQGIAHRKWIVSYKWIEDCIEQGKLLDETPYEAMTLSDGITDDGPQRSRLRKKDLFEGFTFWCVGPYLNVSPNQYESLLLATGAIVVDSLETLAKKEGMKGIVIQDGVHDDKEIEHWYRTAKAAPISDSWIVNCISNYKLFNLASYVHLSLEDVYAIGFPQELIGEYSDGEE